MSPARQNLVTIFGYLEAGRGSQAESDLAPSDRGRLRYNEAEQRWEVSVNGGAWDPLQTFGSAAWVFSDETTTGSITAPVSSPVFERVDTTSGALTRTLPDATTVASFPISVKKHEDAPAGNKVTVDTTGGQTIDGLASVDIIVPGDVLRFLSDGSNWMLH